MSAVFFASFHCDHSKLSALRAESFGTGRASRVELEGAGKKLAPAILSEALAMLIRRFPIVADEDKRSFENVARAISPVPDWSETSESLATSSANVFGVLLPLVAVVVGKHYEGINADDGVEFR